MINKYQNNSVLYKRITLIFLIGLVLLLSINMTKFNQTYAQDSLLKNGNLIVDISNAEYGHVSTSAQNIDANDGKVRIRVQEEDNTYTYYIFQENDPIVFPLHYGNGTYTVTLYQNVYGTKYRKDGEITFTINNIIDNSIYLEANQFVNYTEGSTAVKVSNELCENITDDTEKLNTIKDYINRHFVYDYIRAADTTILLPDIEYCVTNQRGICYDLAALACCMLRVQNIPTKFVIGHVNPNNYYHAWIETYINNQWIIYDPTFEIGQSATIESYTPEQWY